MKIGWFRFGLFGATTIAAGLVLSGCTKKSWIHPPRSQACDDAVNKCMEKCANPPDAFSQRNQAYPDKTGTVSSYGSSCEATCQSKC